MRVRDRIRSVLETAGTTYAEQTGIRLADRPAPLYRLLVLSVLLSTRIKADIAVAAARELFAAGCGTPRGMLKASGWTYPASRSDWPDWWMLRNLPALAAALVRVSLDAKLARKISE